MSMSKVLNNTVFYKIEGYLKKKGKKKGQKKREKILKLLKYIKKKPQFILSVYYYKKSLSCYYLHFIIHNIFPPNKKY